jgi:hypothetical protein
VSATPRVAAHAAPDGIPANARQQTRARGQWLLALSVFGFVVLSVAYMESAALPGVTGRLVAELAFLVPLVLSVLLCGRAYRRSRGAERRFWLMSTGLNAVLLVSELYYVWWIAYYGAPPPGIYAPFQAMHVVAAVFFYLVLVSMTRMARDPAAAMVAGYVGSGRRHVRHRARTVGRPDTAGAARRDIAVADRRHGLSGVGLDHDRRHTVDAASSGCRQMARMGAHDRGVSHHLRGRYHRVAGMVCRVSGRPGCR